MELALKLLHSPEALDEAAFLAVFRQSSRENAPEWYPDLSPEQALERFCASCRLTPRESEVLQKLLESDDSLQLIAADLSISVRMVQRYVTAIYEKTGAKSRTGLHQRYMQHMLENR